MGRYEPSPPSAKELHFIVPCPLLKMYLLTMSRLNAHFNEVQAVADSTIIEFFLMHGYKIFYLCLLTKLCVKKRMIEESNFRVIQF